MEPPYTCITCDDLPDPGKLDANGQCDECRQYNPIATQQPEKEPTP